MKLPQQAKRVFEGVIYDVYHWQQPLPDGSSATFEMLKRPNTLQVIPVQDETIFIAKEIQPVKGEFYGLLGGRQEPGETPLEGAKREFLEETGMVASDWDIYGVCAPITKIEWEVHTFIAKGLKQLQEPHLDPGENIVVLSVSFDEFVEIVLSDQFFGKELQLDILKMLRMDSELTALKQLLF